MLSFFKSFFIKNVNKKILFIGYPGKTTLLYSIFLKEKIEAMPTPLYNVETITSLSNKIKSTDIKYNIWELGGNYLMKPLLFKNHCKDVEGAVFFMSSLNFDESIEDLNAHIYKYSLPNIPMVLFIVERDLTVNNELLSEENLLSKLKEKVFNKLDKDVNNKRVFKIVFGSALCSISKHNIIKEFNKEHIAIFEWLDKVLCDDNYIPEKYDTTTSNMDDICLNIINLSKPTFLFHFMKVDIKEKNDYYYIKENTKDIVFKQTYDYEISSKDLIHRISELQDYNNSNSNDINSYFNDNGHILNKLTILRIMYVILRTNIRREAVNKIINLLSKLNNNSNNSYYIKYGLTEIYFYISMLYLALTKEYGSEIIIRNDDEIDIDTDKDVFDKTELSRSSFISFILKHLWILNNKLLEYFYSYKELDFVLKENKDKWNNDISKEEFIPPLKNKFPDKL